MTKIIAGILLAVISVGLIGGVIYTSNKETDKEDSSSDSSHFNENHKDDGHHDDEKSADSANSSQVEPNTVLIEDYKFGPMDLKVKVGTTVTWVNNDTAKHDITPDMESPDFVGSKLLAKGESYTFTFNKAGTYSYICSPHPYMKASVEVTE